ncbi:MAG: hypothetical protein KGL53_14975 [Elusimicrobia bacterium]|nr:hypothetical protein [Elusimicrobiota bacterium]
MALVRKLLAACCAAAALLAGCRGTAPDVFSSAALGYGAVVVRGRIILPEGETSDGMMWLNLESPNDRYRLKFIPGETTLARVEPDVYKLYPTRDALGMVQPLLTVRIAGRNFKVPFPRDILRKDPVEVRPTKVVALGVLEARLLPIERGRAPRIDVHLDDSNDARRHLLEDMISMMMDPKATSDERDSAVSWTRALEQALQQVQAEPAEHPTYKIPQ